MMMVVLSSMFDMCYPDRAVVVVETTAVSIVGEDDVVDEQDLMMVLR